MGFEECSSKEGIGVGIFWPMILRTYLSKSLELLRRCRLERHHKPALLESASYSAHYLVVFNSLQTAFLTGVFLNLHVIYGD